MDKHTITIIISLFAFAISAISAYFVYSRNKFYKNITNDEKLFDELVKILDRAYESFSMKDLGKDNEINKEIKYWRNCARYIITYEKLCKNIKTRLYKSLCNETEEFYRLKFHTLLSKNKNKFLLPNYNETLDVNPTAIAVIIAFSYRRHWAEDPLEKVDLKEMIREKELYSHLTSFESFMKKHHPSIYKETIKK